MIAEQNNFEEGDDRLLHSLKLGNILSFGEESEEIIFQPLNLLIGPNGSGKSNLIDVIDLLRSAPKDLLKPIRESGGIQDWLWKGSGELVHQSSINAIIANPAGLRSLSYNVAFTTITQRFKLTQEFIEDAVFENEAQPLNDAYYAFNKGHPFVLVNGSAREIEVDTRSFNSDLSILSQLRDPFQYPEITHLAHSLEKVRIYRDWQFGRKNPARLPQKADLPNDYLAEDASNLGLVLNRFKREPAVKKRVIEALGELYDGIEDYDVSIEGGTVQVFLQEGNTTIPATRLSDGTLRYLCLLAILCHPNPPPLVCIEEPELGLHPDIMPALAQLLKEASTRSQLIVTTHSDELVDAMTDQPESVLVCERSEEGTTLTRLNAETLKPWLEKYRLGELWTKGEIGGMRW